MAKRDGIWIAIIAGLFGLAAAALGPWVTAQLDRDKDVPDLEDASSSNEMGTIGLGGDKSLPGRDELARRLIFGSWRSPDESCEYAREFSVTDGKIEIRYKDELKDVFILDAVSESGVTAHKGDSKRSFTVDGGELVYDNGSQSVRMEACR